MILPLTNKEIEPIERWTTCCYCNIHSVAKCVSLYGVISSLLLPFTVRGRIGGQYGVLIHPDQQPDPTQFQKLLNLADMSVTLEAFLIGLLVLVHLLGFMKSGLCILLYLFVRVAEIVVTFFWLASVGTENIKSHVMSQFSLGWYCVFAFVIEVISAFIMMIMAIESIKCKNE